MQNPWNIIHFPFMHPEFVPSDVRKLAWFLNPGLEAGSEFCYTPEALVLDPKQAKSFLEYSQQFGEQFSRPSEIAYFGAQQMEDFYSHTALAIRSELSHYDQQDLEKEDTQDYLQAQQLLLLDFSLEERIIELQGIDEELQQHWSQFDKDLGIDEEEERFWAPDREAIISRLEFAHMSKLLWAFGLYLPREGCLLVHEDEVCSELEELGVTWEPEEFSSFFSLSLPNRKLYSARLDPARLKLKHNLSDEIPILRVGQESQGTK